LKPSADAADSAGNPESYAISLRDGLCETTRIDSASRSMTSDPRPFPLHDAKPPSLEVLRAKLDAAIVAEAWEAVTAIRERIVQIEQACPVAVPSLRHASLRGER